jgi:hypothetical protein
MRRLAGLLMLLALAPDPGPAGAQAYATPGADRYFRVEWELTTVRRGPVITGYVYNQSENITDNVRVLVEALDADGRVVAEAWAYVVGAIPINGRRLFQASVRGGAATYRVRVVTFDWVGRGAG